jgi:hypothetical protein
VRRVPGTTLLIAGVAISLAACGGSSKGSSGAAAGTSSTPTATPTAAPSPLTTQEAHALAVAAQLQTSDLPGYKEDKSGAGNADKPDATDKQLQACISGPATPTYLADVNSSDFSKGSTPLAQVTVSSETQVVPTAEQGQQEFTTLQKPETLTCLNNALTKALSGQAQGATFSGALRRTDAAAPPGADGVQAFVLDGSFAQQGISVKLHAGLELVLVGRAELSLTSFAIGDQSLPDTERDRLMAAVVTRARDAQK